MPEKLRNSHKQGRYNFNYNNEFIGYGQNQDGQYFDDQYPLDQDQQYMQINDYSQIQSIGGSMIIGGHDPLIYMSGQATAQPTIPIEPTLAYQIQNI